MEHNNNPNIKRNSLFTAGALMMVSALLYWICDIGTVFALCLGAAGLCFFGAGFNIKNEKNK